MFSARRINIYNPRNNYTLETCSKNRTRIFLQRLSVEARYYLRTNRPSLLGSILIEIYNFVTERKSLETWQIVKPLLESY